MTLATFFLLSISGIVAVKLVGLTNKRGRLKYLGLAIAAVLVTVTQLMVFIDYLINDPAFTSATEFIVEWGHITILAFIMSSLAIFIRESKPVFAQFPMIYTAFPLLIVFSYMLVRDTYALKTWLTAIYQGGTIMVALLMYSVYTYRNKNDYAVILGGIALFLITYILYWYVGDISENYAWIWKVLVAVAMIIVTFGYEQTEESAIINAT